MRRSGAYWIVVSVVVGGLGTFGGAQPFAGDMSFFVCSSKPDGTAFGVDADRTCANWTSSGAGAAAARTT